MSAWLDLRRASTTCQVDATCARRSAATKEETRHEPTNTKAVPPPPNGPETRKKLLNAFFLHEEDELFKWAKTVKAVVCDGRKKPSKPRGRVARARGAQDLRKSREGRKIAKLTAEGYELLDPSLYMLEVIKAEPHNGYGPQRKLKLRVAVGAREGFEFVDYSRRGTEDGIKVGTKAWDIFEACLDRRLVPDEELDTDELIGKRFRAMVSIKRSGKGNRVEYGTIGAHRPKKAEEPKRP